MAAIQVAKLKLRCSDQQRARARFAIEDGLRTAIPDDRRLVLVRRMQLPGEVDSLHPARRQDAVRAGWLAAISDARHGAGDGAADANCVWFASRQEAETALIARLLAGRGVEAWYWRLALPDWRGQPLRTWVSGLLEDALARDESRRLLVIAQTFVSAGAVDQLVDLLHGLPEGSRATASNRPFAAELGMETPPPRPVLDGLAETAAATAAHCIRLDLGEVITKLMRAGEGARVVAQAIVRAWTIKRSPALALSPALAAATVAATMNALTAPERGRSPPATAPRGRGPSRRPIATSRAWEPMPPHDRPPFRPEARPEPSLSDPIDGRVESPLMRREDSADFPAALVVPRRLHSDHAGLWLVVPSLIELGFRDWLAASPALLGDGPGAQLLREIACRHRVALDDPALVSILTAGDPGARPEWCRMWRHGLDRWLRRTAGRRLHDLVNRPGELSLGDQTLVIHYPAADADLALRRRALDRDPGWTDWLGLSIRYNFGGTEDWL